MRSSSGGSIARGFVRPPLPRATAVIPFVHKDWVRYCHPIDKITRVIWPGTPLEPQPLALRDGVVPGGYPELAVDRLSVRLDRIRRDVEFVADLAEGERAAEQAQDRRLALGERLGGVLLRGAAADPPVEFGQPRLEHLGAVRQGGQHLSRLLGQFRGAALVPRFEAYPRQQERGHDGAPRAESRRLPAKLEHRLELAAGLVELAPRG